MILVAQIIASHKFLVSLGIKSIPLVIVFWAIVIFYTAYGGLKSVISTDLVQAAFFCLVFFACLGFVAFANPISLTPIETFAAVSSKISGWLLMPLLFMVIEQDMGQRCFAGRTPRVVSRACLLAGLGTMAVCVVPVLIGSLAHTLDLSVPPGGSVLMTAIATLTNPWMTAIVGCAVLAAIISTATSLINAIGSNLSNDFSFSFLRKINPVLVVQGITYAISLAALCFAFQFNNIVDLLIQSYELSVSCLFVPICLALFKRSGSFHAALLSILLGAAGFFLFRMVPMPLPKEIASIGLSFVGYAAGALYTRQVQRKRHKLSKEVGRYQIKS
jgi:SSS family solute:Na+ symporter